MKITIFEGTPEELREAAPHLFPDGLPKNTGNLPFEGETEIDPKEAYRAMLKRRRIQKGQMDLYRVLSEVKDLEYQEYLNRMNRSAQTIAGLHGALGRRINNTPEIHKAGLPGNTAAIMIWRQDKDMSYLGLKPEFIDVLKEEEII